MGTSFGQYLYFGFVNAAGGPEQRGRFRKKLVLPKTTAQFAAESTVLAAIGLGTADTTLAIRAAAQNLTDKSRAGATKLLRKNLSSTEDLVAASPQLRPWSAIAKPTLGELYEHDLDFDILGTESAARLLASAGLFGIGWGLEHPGEAHKHYELMARDQLAAGEPLLWENWEAFQSQCLLFAEDWAAENGPLPRI